MNRLLFIFNPTSGTGQVKAALAPVLDVFTKAGWITTSYPTQCKGDATRVAREPIRKLAPSDRLMKPLMTAYSYGLSVDHLIFGAAAALHFNCPEDEQSVELMKAIETDGVEKALEKYAGLKPEDALFTRILDVYRALAVAKKGS